MPEVKVKNIGSPVIIGGRLVPGGNKVTPVDEEALKDYCKAVSGSHVFKNFLTVIDEDYEKRMEIEAEAANNLALNEARKKVEPLIKKELAEKIGKEFAKKIEGLNDKIEELVKENTDLKEANLAALAGNVIDPNEKKVDDDKAPGDEDEKDIEFVFDPEKHHIEHRGGGNWFIMDQEEKVHGPLSDEDRAKYEELIK